MVKRNRNVNPSQIPADFAIPKGTHMSARTISHLLNQVGFLIEKHVKCISFQPRYRRERLYWCKEHNGWGHKQCFRVMFSDEFHLTVTSDSGHQILRRERGTCFIQHYVLECDRYNSGVLVCAGIMHSDRTPLHIFERGNVTFEQYYSADSVYGRQCAPTHLHSDIIDSKK